MIGAGEGNRTLVISLEGCCSTIELHPHLFTVPLGTMPLPIIRTLNGGEVGLTRLCKFRHLRASHPPNRPNFPEKTATSDPN